MCTIQIISVIIMSTGDIVRYRFVIEGNEMGLNDARRLLERAGFSGAEAIEYIRALREKKFVQQPDGTLEPIDEKQPVRESDISIEGKEWFNILKDKEQIIIKQALATTSKISAPLWHFSDLAVRQFVSDTFNFTKLCNHVEKQIGSPRDRIMMGDWLHKAKNLGYITDIDHNFGVRYMIDNLYF